MITREDMEEELAEARQAQRHVSAALDTCVKRLAEARAALRDINGVTTGLPDGVTVPSRFLRAWRERHAAAIKAARKTK